MSMASEREMFIHWQMPDKGEVAQAILRFLFRHNGTIPAFGDDEKIVSELADEFKLDSKQRTVQLEQMYRKENRIKRSNLWFRLLFRASEYLVQKQLVARPSALEKITKRKGWMLTETGYDAVLRQFHLAKDQKDILSVQSLKNRVHRCTIR